MAVGCANSRIEIVKASRNADRKRAGRAAICSMLGILLLATSAAGAPPAPQFLPGFPLQAGPVVMIMWAPVPGAVKYKILVNGKVTTEAPVPPAQIPTPEEPGEFRIEITAVDAAGGESETSKPGIIRVVKLVPPKEIVARATGDAVILAWQPVPGGAIYNIFRSEKNDKNMALLTSIQDTRYSDSTVKKGERYFYALSVKDLSGKESALSPVASVQISQEVASKKEEKKFPIKVVPAEVSLELSSTLDTAIDSVSDLLFLDGVVYAVDQGKSTLMAFNRDGEGRILVKGGAGEAQLRSAMGLGKGPGKTIAVAEGTTGKIKLYDREGTFVRAFSMPPAPEEWPAKMKERFKGKMGASRDVDTSAAGNVYVVDDIMNRVVEFDANGAVVAQHGKGGFEKGEFNGPKSVLVLDDGRILVGEGVGRRVQVFDASFQYAEVFGQTPDWVGSILSITGLSKDPRNGMILAVDGPMHTFQAFDGKTFEYLHHIGGPAGALDKSMEQQRPVPFTGYPVGIAVDDRGRFWVSNPQEKRILVIQPK